MAVLKVGNTEGSAFPWFWQRLGDWKAGLFGEVVHVNHQSLPEDCLNSFLLMF